MKPYILVEPFAGMTALSFATMGCKPPISWMGSKRGYTGVLMDLLGLSKHKPPCAFIWSDVGPNVAALATLAGAGGDARDVAGWFSASELAARGDPAAGYAGEQERYDAGKCWTKPNIKGCSDAVDFLPLPRAAEVAAIIRGWKDEEPRALWTRLKAAGWPSLMPPKGARWGQPIVGRWLGPARVEEVAGLLFVTMRSWSNYEPGHVYKDYEKHADSGTRGEPAPPVPVLADRVDALPSRWPRVACYQGTATRLVEQLPADLSGVLVYVDGPYHGDGSRKITGYKFGGCSREEQLALVADCHRRGARVAMSESVPLAAELRALTGGEWWAVDITEHREGQARTFGGTHEWVTMNHAPKHTRAVQTSLFGGR